MRDDPRFQPQRRPDRSLTGREDLFGLHQTYGYDGRRADIRLCMLPPPKGILIDVRA